MLDAADILKAKLLIVDDQDANTLFFHVMVKQLGYTDVHTAKSGAEAEAHVPTSHGLAPRRRQSVGREESRQLHAPPVRRAGRPGS